MSYGGVENTLEELEILVGSTIKKMEIMDDGFGQTKTVMTVQFPKGYMVNGHNVGCFEVWMDEEGNGPGYLAFVGHEVTIGMGDDGDD